MALPEGKARSVSLNRSLFVDCDCSSHVAKCIRHLRQEGFRAKTLVRQEIANLGDGIRYTLGDLFYNTSSAEPAYRYR